MLGCEYVSEAEHRVKNKFGTQMNRYVYMAAVVLRKGAVELMFT